MEEWQKYAKYWYIPVLCLCCLGFLYLNLQRHGVEDSSVLVDSQTPFQNSAENQADQPIFVDISGAVNRPGFYQLKEGDRIVDAVKATEGFSKQAHVGFLSQKLNLSEKLRDGEKIYIPFVFEEDISTLTEDLAAKCFESVSSSKSSDSAESQSPNEDTGTVDVNSATKAELVALPGIGDVTADKIINGRPYSTIDDFYTFIKFSSKAKAALEGLLTAR